MSVNSQQAMDVQLENFEGPLDLLLYLIKKNDLSISDIPIAQITREYLDYLNLMKDLNLDVAGEFLVMASTLMQIKAQMLLPAPETNEEEGGPDPRHELVNKLMEYQRFKEAATVLSGWNEKAKNVYYRNVPPAFEEGDFVLKAATVDLVAAFKRVLDRAPREVGQVMREEIPIEVKIREILDLLETHASIAFEELFKVGMRKLDLIVTFMALLELIRLKQLVAMQAEIFGDIRLYRPDSVPVRDVPAEVVEEEAPRPSALFLSDTEAPLVQTHDADPLIANLEESQTLESSIVDEGSLVPSELPSEPIVAETAAVPLSSSPEGEKLSTPETPPTDFGDVIHSSAMPPEVGEASMEQPLKTQEVTPDGTIGYPENH